MKVFIVTATHPFVPGVKISAHESRAGAIRRGLALLDDIRDDLELPLFNKGDWRERALEASYSIETARAFDWETVWREAKTAIDEARAAAGDDTSFDITIMRLEVEP